MNRGTIFSCIVCKKDVEGKLAYFLNKGYVTCCEYEYSLIKTLPEYNKLKITYEIIYPGNLKCFCPECFDSIAGKDYL